MSLSPTRPTATTTKNAPSSNPIHFLPSTFLDPFSFRIPFLLPCPVGDEGGHMFGTRFCESQGKPWLLLLPNYVAVKSYFFPARPPPLFFLLPPPSRTVIPYPTPAPPPFLSPTEAPHPTPFYYLALFSSLNANTVRIFAPRRDWPRKESLPELLVSQVGRGESDEGLEGTWVASLWHEWRN